MTRLQWYHHLRSGLTPMKASHAWTQALIYEGKALGDPYFLPFAGDLLKHIDSLVIANYTKAINRYWNSQAERRSFMDLIMAKR